MSREKSVDSVLFGLLVLIMLSVGADAYAKGWYDKAKEWATDEYTCSQLTGTFSIAETKADGSNWDFFHADRDPDPTGVFIVYRDGKEFKREGLSTRHNKLNFSAPFFAKSGIVLKKGDIISIRLSDYDENTANDPIGTARINVNGRQPSGQSSNSLFEVTITCEE